MSLNQHAGQGWYGLVVLFEPNYAFSDNGPMLSCIG
jgi:hypothetical protein